MTQCPIAETQIHPSVQFGKNVILGHNVTIEANVTIGDNCRLDANVYIGHDTNIGNDCHFYPGAVVGTDPQDLSYNPENKSTTTIGNGVQIREYATVHRGTGKDTDTKVGDHCYLMAYSHVGHNCQLGEHVILANSVHLGGYVTVGDYSNIGGGVVVHQFVRIGRLVMMGGFGGIRQDLPPFCLAAGEGSYGGPKAINLIGLKRRAVSKEDCKMLREAYKILWFRGHTKAIALAQLEEQFPNQPLVEELVEFIKTSKRGIHKPNRNSATVEAEE